MFERYTGKARRAIFFARYEASLFANAQIEPHHLLLGLLRADRALALHLLKTMNAVESLRQQVVAHSPKGPGVSVSADLPLSQESKRVLVYGAEEAERIGQAFIGTHHLFLGILRESGCLAAAMLTERQVNLEDARVEVVRVLPEIRARAEEPPAVPAALIEYLAGREKAGDITVAAGVTLGGQTVEIAVFEGAVVYSDGDPLPGAEAPKPGTPAQEIAALRRKIRRLIALMITAISQHEFEAARAYSDEERQLRQELAEVSKTHDPAEPVPFLCILAAQQESLSELRGRIGALLDAGAANVWLLDAEDGRIYTATLASGLSEVTGPSVGVEHPRLEIARDRIFP